MTDHNATRGHYRETSRRLALDREVKGGLIFAAIYFVIVAASIIAILF